MEINKNNNLTTDISVERQTDDGFGGPGVPVKVTKYPCIETTHDIYLSGELLVRLWINKDEIPAKFDESIEEAVREINFENHKDLIEKIIEVIPNLNAVQINFIDNEREISRGVVVYTVDFGADIHG